MTPLGSLLPVTTSGAVPTAAGAVVAAPADLDADEARSRLRRELLDPDYQEDVLGQILDWVGRVMDEALTAASGVPALSWVAALAVGLLLAVGLGLVLGRVRRGAGRRGVEVGPVLARRATAAEHRARAEEALRSGDHREAVVEAYRALAVRQVERRRIEDVPQATAHEVGDLLAEAFAPDAGRVRSAADHFDLALYGDRAVDPAAARAVLVLDDEWERR